MKELQIQKDRPPSEARVSDILVQLSEGSTVGTVADILTKMEERAIGALLCIFSFPCSIPSPPGVQTVFGWPIIFVSFQLVIGRNQIWLPARIMNLSVKGKIFSTLARKGHPLVLRLERICKPRLPVMTSKPAERVIGLVILLLGIKLLLPLPLTNNPAGIASTITSLGLLEKDGVIIIMGLFAGIAVLTGTVWLYGTLIYSTMTYLF